VIYPDGGTRTYVYNEIGRINGGTPCTGQSPVGNGYGAAISALTGIIDENGSRYLSWSYDCSGRVILSEVGNGTRKTALSYGNTASTGSLRTYSGREKMYPVTVQTHMLLDGGHHGHGQTGRRVEVAR
jgi:hypothetical protein